MKLKMLFLFVAVFIAQIANAQSQFFIKSTDELTPSTSVTIVYVDGLKLVENPWLAREVSGKLSNDSYYWDSVMRKRCSTSNEVYTYDSSLSTSKYEVYKKEYRDYRRAQQYQYYDSYGRLQFGFRPGPITAYYFVALSSDGKSMIKWMQPVNSDEVRNKVYYDRVDESDLAIDSHDFLR